MGLLEWLFGWHRCAFTPWSTTAQDSEDGDYQIRNCYSCKKEEVRWP